MNIRSLSLQKSSIDSLDVPWKRLWNLLKTVLHTNNLCVYTNLLPLLTSDFHGVRKSWSKFWENRGIQLFHKKKWPK